MWYFDVFIERELANRVPYQHYYTMPMEVMGCIGGVTTTNYRDQKYALCCHLETLRRLYVNHCHQVGNNLFTVTMAKQIIALDTFVEAVSDTIFVEKVVPSKSAASSVARIAT